MLVKHLVQIDTEVGVSLPVQTFAHACLRSDLLDQGLKDKLNRCENCSLTEWDVTVPANASADV